MTSPIIPIIDRMKRWNIYKTIFSLQALNIEIENPIIKNFTPRTLLPLNTLINLKYFSNPSK
jgi:hypothetical protein